MYRRRYECGWESLNNCAWFAWVWFSSAFGKSGVKEEGIRDWIIIVMRCLCDWTVDIGEKRVERWMVYELETLWYSTWRDHFTVIQLISITATPLTDSVPDHAPIVSAKSRSVYCSWWRCLFCAVSWKLLSVTLTRWRECIRRVGGAVSLDSCYSIAIFYTVQYAGNQFNGYYSESYYQIH